MIRRLRLVLRLLPFALLLALPLALYQPATADPAEPAEPAEPTEPAEPAEPLSPEAGMNWAGIVSLTNGTNSPNGAERPALAVAPDGKTVMVAYLKLTANANDADPFYRLSRDNGATWESPKVIKNTPTRARQVHVTYDANNRAHAVWTEANNIVAYAKENNWGGNTYKNISTALILVEGPRIVASGSGRLDLVWAQNDGADLDIYHSFSTNGNAGNPAWSTAKIIRATAPKSQSPDIAVDARGHIHVVWEEQVPSNSVIARIRYTRSTNGGNTWSDPINISNRSNPTDARRPRIIADGNVLHVSFTDSETQNRQFVHHLSCSAANCSLIGNWVSDGRISGAQLGIRTVDPADIISTLTQNGVCTFVYFHGINASLDPQNEMVWGASSCDGWSKRVRLTPVGARAIKPSMATQSDWWVYLAYERVAAERQIRFVRNQPAIYLPIMLRK